MKGANGGSRYNVPFRIIPDLPQIPQEGNKSDSSQVRHVLDSRVIRAQFFDESFEM
jgi:hypothetical protein